MAENAGKAHTGLALDPRIGCAEQRENQVLIREDGAAVFRHKD